MYCIPVATALLYTLAAPNCGDVFYSNYDNHIGCTAFSAAAPVVATALPALLYVSEVSCSSGGARLLGDDASHLFDVGRAWRRAPLALGI